MARPEGVKVDRISLSPTFKNDQFYFNDTLYKLVWSWRLLQGDRPRFEKLILSDISIHLTFTSVHPGQLGNLVGLALWDRMTTPFKPNEEEERVPNGDEVAQMVMEQFKVPVASGLPVFFSNRSIEIAYQYNASIENTFALAQVIAQELRGGNDNVMDQREIEKTQIEDAINFVDNKTMDQKIKNSKLQNNQIDQLQKIRSRRLKQFQGELYEDNVNQITRLDNVNDLNRLFDNINNIEFNEIKTGIEKETDTAKLEVDWSDKIDSAKYISKDQKDTLHHLRNDKHWNLKENK
ncbi:18482_t:CDS:2 [Gigaspora rosea]|nr:18482_t:CDS:2 [Gigaspora rosea]